MYRNFATIISLILLSIPASVIATEGALEINQACVADGCFPGDTAGFPVTITTRGNYILTSNITLENTTQSAILVHTDNVMIDMKGFGIFGPNVCTGINGDCTYTSTGGTGVASFDTNRNITVRDGIIRGMGFAGIDIGKQSTVEGIVTEHSYRVGIRVRAGSTISNSNSNFNGELGMEAGESRVIDCSASDNGMIGFAIGRSILTRADVSRTNAQTGILDAYGSQIHDSVSRDNPTGIESINGATSVINSTIISNSGLGIFARGGTGAGDPNGMPILLSGNTIVLNNGGNANPQLGGGGTFVELSTNYCGANTTCP